MAKKMVTMKAPGKKPITFKKGGLHQQLGVPAGEKIPASKMAAAEKRVTAARRKAKASDGKMPAGTALLAKRLGFAKGVLKTGRETAARRRRAKK